MTEQLILIVITAIVTSAGSAMATVVGLRVHIDYIRTELKEHADVHREHRDEFKRVHRRIDEVHDKLIDKECRLPAGGVNHL